MKAEQYSLWRVARRHAGGFLGGALLVVLMVAVQLALPFVVRHLIDLLGDGELTRRELLWGVLLYAASLPPAAAVSYWMRRLPLRTGHQVEYEVRRDLFAHLSRQDPVFFQGERIGDLMTRMGSDLHVVRDALGHGALHITRAAAALVMAFPVLFRMHPGLAAWLLLLMMIMVLSSGALMHAIRRRHERLQEQVSNLGHTVEETFSGIRTVKGFALEDRRRRRFAIENRTLLRRAMALHLAQAPIWPLFALWFALQMAVVLVYGGRMVLRGHMSLGDLVLVNQYLLYLQWPVLSLGWMGSMLQRARVSWRRLRELFDRRPAIADGPETDTGITALEGAVEWRNVQVASGGRAILQGISLRLPAGTTLGITGPTGAGKTTLVALLARLADPSQGLVLIDGHPLPTIPLDVLRRHVGFAQQEPMLFSDTLEENLAFGLEHDTGETVRWAAHVAHLEEDIERFPERYATRVGERGVTLSGGQRQRAALGRALARNPRILILDDVLAAVDTQTEAAILDKLAPVARDRTTLLVSHRLSTLHRADLVVVLEDGRITQQGTHAELLARPGYYADTYRLQQLEADLKTGKRSDG